MGEQLLDWSVQGTVSQAEELLTAVTEYLGRFTAEEAQQQVPFLVTFRQLLSERIERLKDVGDGSTEATSEQGE